MSPGRGDLRERLRIDRVRERATEFYGRTVESSDDASEHGAARRGDGDVSGSTDGRFELSTWLGSSRVVQPDGGEIHVADSDQSDDSSTAEDGSAVDDATQTESTDTDAEFDFRGWLAEGDDDVAALDGTATETADASAAERTGQLSAETTSPESSAAEPAGFDFAAWVRTGDTGIDSIRDPAEPDEEPVESDRERAEPTADATEPVEAAESTGGGVLDSAAPSQTTTRAAASVRRGTPSAASVLEVHPVKAATLALFLAFVALAVLSMVGYLPPLGPSTGLGV